MSMPVPGLGEGRTGRSTLPPTVPPLVNLATAGLQSMWRADHQGFAERVRPAADGDRLVVEGMSRRHTAVAVLGLGTLPVQAQQEVLAGVSAGELARRLPDWFDHTGLVRDPGEQALAAWASAEVGGRPCPSTLRRLHTTLSEGAPVPTSELAWTACAALATLSLGTGGRTDRVADALLDDVRARLHHRAGPSGLLPHLAGAADNRLRAHVGTFADQAFAALALTRLSVTHRDGASSRLAASVADRLVASQGPAGQWWWHYDVRDGSVLEGYPVFSAHQGGIAPLALLGLTAPGGPARETAVLRGLEWLADRPESDETLLDDAHGVVWRSVRRREPGRLVRGLTSAASAVRPGVRLPGVDRAFRAGTVERSCRPDDLGWVLYGWGRR